MFGLFNEIAATAHMANAALFGEHDANDNNEGGASVIRNHELADHIEAYNMGEDLDSCDVYCEVVDYMRKNNIPADLSYIQAIKEGIKPKYTDKQITDAVMTADAINFVKSKNLINISKYDQDIIDFMRYVKSSENGQIQPNATSIAEKCGVEDVEKISTLMMLLNEYSQRSKALSKPFTMGEQPASSQQQRNNSKKTTSTKNNNSQATN